MNYGMYASAAGAMANSYRLDVVANNLANVDTVAFKRDLAMFTARPTQAEEDGGRRYTTDLLENMGGGLFALPTYTDFTAASLKQTGGVYDLAISGNGFFQIAQGDQTLYTRDGRLSIDDSGQLVTLDDHLPILDEDGQTIKLDRQLDTHIDATGLISQAGEDIARLAIVDFDRKDNLIKTGSNRFMADGVQPHPVESRIMQQYLEESGINPVSELTAMIRTQRMLESNLNLLQIQSQTLSQAATRLGMISG